MNFTENMKKTPSTLSLDTPSRKSLTHKLKLLHNISKNKKIDPPKKINHKLRRILEWEGIKKGLVHDVRDRVWFNLRLKKSPSNYPDRIKKWRFDPRRPRINTLFDKKPFKKIQKKTKTLNPQNSSKKIKSFKKKLFSTRYLKSFLKTRKLHKKTTSTPYIKGIKPYIPYQTYFKNLYKKKRAYYKKAKYKNNKFIPKKPPLSIRNFQNKSKKQELQKKEPQKTPINKFNKKFDKYRKTLYRGPVKMPDYSRIDFKQLKFNNLYHIYKITIAKAILSLPKESKQVQDILKTFRKADPLMYAHQFPHLFPHITQKDLIENFNAYQEKKLKEPIYEPSRRKGKKGKKARLRTRYPYTLSYKNKLPKISGRIKKK